MPFAGLLIIIFVIFFWLFKAIVYKGMIVIVILNGLVLTVIKVV